MRVVVLRNVSGVIDGAEITELSPGHFYDLPSAVARRLIQQHAAFEVPASDDVRDVTTGSTDRQAANAPWR
jgi:hypothetical protein